MTERGVFAEVASLVRGFVTDLLARLVFGVVAMVGPVAACDGEAPIIPPEPTIAAEPPVAEAPVTPAAPTAEVPAETGPHQLGFFSITFYYVIGEEEIPAHVAAKKPEPANDNGSDDQQLADIAPVQEVTTLYAGDCKPIAEVAPEFASQLALQGTGKLKDGRVLNIWGSCSCAHSPCFKVTENQWGSAGSGRPLQPFRTVAVDPKVIKIGSLLYVPLLEGRTMPGRSPWGGFVHDGCVVADDVGGGIDGNKLDLFVGRKAYFLGLSGREGLHSWAKHVEVYDGSKICERKGREIGRRVGSI